MSTIVSRPFKVVYTDQPGTNIFFRSGILCPSTYNFSPPQRFGKLFVHLIGSLIGLDQTLVLEGNDVTLASSFVQLPKRQSRKDRDEKATSNDMKILEPQLKQGNMKSEQIKPLSKSQEITQNGRSDDEFGCLAKHYRSSIDLGNIEGNTFINQRKPEPSLNLMQNPARVHHKQSDENQVFSIIHSEQTPLRKRDKSTPVAIPSRVALVTPATAPHQCQDESQHISGRQQGSTPDKRKWDTSNSWIISQRKQQRTQRRAFASQSDNPFAFFQHDPNDAESFLESLSERSQQNQSCIIPEKVLQKFTRENNRRERFTRSHNIHPRATVQRRRRQILGSAPRVCNKDILRKKAQEASTCTGKVAPELQQTNMRSMATPWSSNMSEMSGGRSYPTEYTRMINAANTSQTNPENYMYRVANNSFDPPWGNSLLSQEKVTSDDRPNHRFQYVGQTEEGHFSQHQHGYYSDHTTLRVCGESNALESSNYMALQDMTYEEVLPIDYACEWSEGIQRDGPISFGSVGPHTSRGDVFAPPEFY